MAEAEPRAGWKIGKPYKPFRHPLNGTTVGWVVAHNDLIWRHAFDVGVESDPICGVSRQENEGQDIAEYAVMLAVILVLVVGTIRLGGTNANNAFSSVASSLQ
jgi:Flp pilus assembly pilin Flp